MSSSQIAYQKSDLSWASLGNAPNGSTIGYSPDGNYWIKLGIVPSSSIQTDSFGNQILSPIVAGAPKFDCDFSISKILTSGSRNGLLVARGDGTCTIDGLTRSMKLSGNAPRIYMYPSDNSKMFVNMEITVEVYAGSYYSNPPSYAGFGISCRSNHQTDQTSTNPLHAYYFKWARDGRIQFEREDHHTDLYVQYPTSGIPVRTFELGKWYKMKFIVRTIQATKAVPLDGYIDFNDGKGFQKMLSFIDAGNWSKAPNPSPLLAAGVDDIAVAIRNDSVNDVRIRNWSIRNVQSLS